MRVAIHQPNYLPWLGYFAKMAQCDAFVLLDDAQFSKNNIINRVRILGALEPRWLTLPVAARLGMTIAEVKISREDWRRSHLSLLRNIYGRAAHFRAVWPVLEEWMASAPDGGLAAINRHFILGIAGRLGLHPAIHMASDMGVDGKSDDRLVAMVAALAPGGTYLSGRGGAGYQEPGKFEAAGLRLDYYRFSHPVYDQGVSGFQQGLSILDALFHIGWDATIQCLRPA